MFSIRKVDRSHAQEVEPLGSKPKFWFRDGDDRLLFKADDRGTGEDWAEVVASRLCGMLGLPHVTYELAAEYDGEQYVRPGVICRNMSPPPKSLILGNQLLLGIVSDYPSAQRFRVKQHTVSVACQALAGLEKPAPEWMPSDSQQIQTALDVFTGYVLFDVWIANQDRHHENWGAIWDSIEGSWLTLAPTFDHGAGMARNLQDAEREERLTTRDRNRSLDVFAAKGRSAFFASVGDSKALPLLDVFREFANRAPKAAALWLDRLRAVARDNVWDILEQVPGDRMSDVCRQFTLELLEANRRRVLDWERTG